MPATVLLRHVNICFCDLYLCNHNHQMFCLYGVGEVTERSYIYRDRPQGTTDTENIPFRIDNSVSTVFNNDINFTCDKMTVYPYWYLPPPPLSHNCLCVVIVCCVCCPRLVGWLQKWYDFLHLFFNPNPSTTYPKELSYGYLSSN